MRRLGILTTLLALAVVAVVVFFWDRTMWELTTPKDPAAGDVVMVVPPGVDHAGALSLLRDRGLARESALVDAFVQRFRRGSPPRAGEYRLSAAFNVVQLLETIESGDVVTHTVVLRAGWTAEEIADALAQANIVERDAFLDVVRDPEVARFLGVPAEGLDGFLFPDVYAFARGRAPVEVAKALVDRFFDVAPAEAFPSRVGGTRDLVRIAGLLERAPVPAKDWRLYAGLLWHRLRSGESLSPVPRAGPGASRVLFGPFTTNGSEPWPPSRPNPGLEALKAAARPADPAPRFLLRREDGGFAYCADLDCFYEAMRGS